MVTRGTIQSGPFQLGYTVEGKGRPALVIGSAVYYPRTFSQALRQSLKLAFVDHRGFAPVTGEVSAADFSFDTVLEDIERVRQHLGLGRVVIIGHSGHGYMALEYAKRYPQHVSHVVMIGTGPSHSAADMQLLVQHWSEAVCPERRQTFERAMAQLPSDIAAAPERRFISFCVRFAARAWFDHTYDPSPLWEGVHTNMAGIDHLWGEVFRDIDVTRGLEQLDMPVFLALGRFDYQVAPYDAWQSRRSAFRDLTFRVFDRSGHSPHQEESAAFDEELLHWLQIASSAGPLEPRME